MSQFVVHILVEADTWQEAYHRLETELDLKNYREDLHLSGGVHIPEQCSLCDGSGMYAIPDWDSTYDCNCSAGGVGWYYGMHESHCGYQPCPAGCPVKPKEK